MSMRSLSGMCLEDKVSNTDDVNFSICSGKDIIVTIYVSNSSKLIDIDRYSSMSKLISVTAFVFRFVNNLNKLCNNLIIKDEHLILEELKNSFDIWIKNEQILLRNESHFKKQQVSLNIFEHNGFLHLKGRFANSNLNEDGKYPILLRRDSNFTKLLIMKVHVMHHGIETTLKEIRLRFWIVKGRATVKSVLSKCVICKRFQGKPLNPNTTPDLPSERISDFSYSFQATGLDFAGPLFTKNIDNTSSKAYMLLFTCATSRAVHLELTPHMKVPAYARAFRRFCSRRGVPDLIVCGNLNLLKNKTIYD